MEMKQPPCAKITQDSFGSWLGYNITTYLAEHGQLQGQLKWSKLVQYFVEDGLIHAASGLVVKATIRTYRNPEKES